MSSFQPVLAAPAIEKHMEALGLPESDRDEVRRLAEVLCRLRDARAGKPLPPAPRGMKDWLLGKDVDGLALHTPGEES